MYNNQSKIRNCLQNKLMHRTYFSLYIEYFHLKNINVVKTRSFSILYFHPKSVCRCLLVRWYVNLDRLFITKVALNFEEKKWKKILYENDYVLTIVIYRQTWQLKSHNHVNPEPTKNKCVDKVSIAYSAITKKKHLQISIFYILQ